MASIHLVIVSALFRDIDLEELQLCEESNKMDELVLFKKDLVTCWIIGEMRNSETGIEQYDMFYFCTVSLFYCAQTLSWLCAAQLSLCGHLLLPLQAHKTRISKLSSNQPQVEIITHYLPVWPASSLSTSDIRPHPRCHRPNKDFSFSAVICFTEMCPNASTPDSTVFTWILPPQSRSWHITVQNDVGLWNLFPY